MKSSKQTPPDPLECSREHEFNHLSRVRHIHLLQEALHPDTPPLTGCDPQKQACEFICITICTRAYEKSANANGIKPRANVSPRSDDWPEWLHLQRGFSYSGQPATEDGQRERQSQRHSTHDTTIHVNSDRRLLTPSVVPVITCRPSYVDLMYMPCRTTRGMLIRTGCSTASELLICFNLLVERIHF